MEFNNSQSGLQHRNGAVVWSAHDHEASIQAEVPVTNPVLVAEQLDAGRSDPSKYSSNYSRVSSLFFGIVQMLLALLSVTGAVLAVVFEAYGRELGTGFWCGLMYGIAGCLATVASGCPVNSLIISVAVFSILCVPFGITAMVLGIMGASYNVNCDLDGCLTLNLFAIAGNALVTTTGFYEILFGVSLFAVSIRAIRKASKTRVTAVTQVFYSTNSPESIQINNASNVYTQNEQQQQQQQHWTTQPVVYVAQEQQRF